MSSQAIHRWNYARNPLGTTYFLNSSAKLEGFFFFIYLTKQGGNFVWHCFLHQATHDLVGLVTRSTTTAAFWHSSKYIWKSSPLAVFWNLDVGKQRAPDRPWPTQNRHTSSLLSSLPSSIVLWFLKPHGELWAQPSTCTQPNWYTIAVGRWGCHQANECLLLSAPPASNRFPVNLRENGYRFLGTRRIVSTHPHYMPVVPFYLLLCTFYFLLSFEILLLCATPPRISVEVSDL